MPLRVDVVDIPQDAFVHHALDGLVKVAVAPLQAGLQRLLGMFGGQGAQGVNFLRLKDQALLAKNVLARHQGVFGDGEVEKQRHRHEHGVDVLQRQEFAVILEGLGIAADSLHTAIEGFLLDIAQRHAAAVVDILEVLQ